MGSIYGAYQSFIPTQPMKVLKNISLSLMTGILLSLSGPEIGNQAWLIFIAFIPLFAAVEKLENWRTIFLYSFLSFFCCLSSVTSARLIIPWWRQVNVELKLLLKQHVLCARKKTHGTASQPCLNLESLLEIFCYVWPFLLWGALPVKSCRYSLTRASGVFH